MNIRCATDWSLTEREQATIAALIALDIEPAGYEHRYICCDCECDWLERTMFPTDCCDCPNCGRRHDPETSEPMWELDR